MDLIPTIAHHDISRTSYQLIDRLVGGLEYVCSLSFSHHIGNVIIPTDFHIFQRG